MSFAYELYQLYYRTYPNKNITLTNCHSITKHLIELSYHITPEKKIPNSDKKDAIAETLHRMISEQFHRHEINTSQSDQLHLYVNTEIDELYDTHNCLCVIS